AQSPVAGFRDPLLAIERSALPGCRRKAGISRDLSSVLEVPEQPLRPEDGGEFGSDALDVEQHRRRRSRSFHGKQRTPLSLDCLDLLEKQFEPVDFTAKQRLQMLRQRTASPVRSSSSRSLRLRRSGSYPVIPCENNSPLMRLT